MGQVLLSDTIVDMSEKLQLVESVKTKPIRQADGSYKIVLITPGLGSTGDYSEEVIRAYCAETWPAGTHSYIDHPTKENPGRSPKNLIGTLREDASYEEGVGAVSYLTPKKHWVDFIEEVAQDCGMSIYAAGTGRKEIREGREVTVVESFTPSVMNSVDLVSYAGRGGKFSESADALLETALGSAQTESSAGTEKKDDENMATLEEALAAVVALSLKFDNFVAEQVAAADKVAVKEAEVAETAVAVKGAIEATRAVETASIPQSVKDSLLVAIEAGDYNVAPRIAEVTSLREELLAEAASNQGGRSFADAAADVHNVKGW